MDMEIPWLSLAAIVVLLGFSAFFSGSETALTAASRARLHQLEKEGSERAGVVNRLISNREKLIGGLLIGNNLVNVLGSALATSTLIALFNEAGVAYATLIMTVLIVIFAEVLPKTYAIHNADRMSMAIAPVIRVVIWSLSPLVFGISWLIRNILRLFGADPEALKALASHEEELRGAIELHRGTDEEIGEERRMLRSILDLGDVDVSEIMTHRSKVEALEADQPAEALVEAILDSPHTRLPIWRDDPDNIVGVLHAKDVLRAVQGRHGAIAKLDLMEIAAKPWFIPDTTTLLDQLQAFRTRREHFAIVVDEYGSLQGVVTLEDILEEIVGDITDEHDIPVAGVRPQPNGSFIIDGSVTLRDLNRRFEWALPDDEASTIAGLVLHEARRIPEQGQVFSFYGFRFEILSRVRNQIKSIRLTPPAQTAPQEPG